MCRTPEDATANVFWFASSLPGIINRPPPASIKLSVLPMVATYVLHANTQQGSHVSSAETLKLARDSFCAHDSVWPSQSAGICIRVCARSGVRLCIRLQIFLWALPKWLLSYFTTFRFLCQPYVYSEVFTSWLVIKLCATNLTDLLTGWDFQEPRRGRALWLRKTTCWWTRISEETRT